MLTADRLRELYSYDHETGLFYHRCGRRGGGTKAGSLAGSKMPDGRPVLGVDRKVYLSYRLAWLYMTGGWPDGDIDHINGDHTDNRFLNLRLATKSQNLANAKRPVTNTSGFKGVHWHRRARKWRATIKSNKKLIHIGYFTCPEEAHKAYIAKAKELFGEFARAA